MIYLDNAATTLRKPPCVIDAVVQATPIEMVTDSGSSEPATRNGDPATWMRRRSAMR